MHYEIALPTAMAQELQAHLLGDRTREQMAIVLCGVRRSGGRVRFLGRHLVQMPAEAFSHQSAGGLELDQSVQRHVLQLAAQEGLSQLDFHTHPGEGSSVGFSGIDDRNERNLTTYLAERLPKTLYASVVLNNAASAARVWEIQNGQPVSVKIQPPDFKSSLLSFRQNGNGFDAGRFDRQVRAFGHEFQQRLHHMKVGVVGLGGLGSVIVEQLARLGVKNWVLVDPDVVEATNLNRLLGATAKDVDEERSKVEVAARNVKRIDAGSRIKTLRCTTFTPQALRALKECDLLIAATDNDASRLTLNALACQYLIPLVHAGVNLDPGNRGKFEDISGEVAIPPLGSWCLLCSGIIDSQRAGWDLASPEERHMLAERGYLTGTPAPAVYHLNALIASLAVTEIHNLVWQYKQRREYLIYRELEGELMPVQVPKSENCLHCGPEGLLGLGDLVPIWNPRRGRDAFGTGLPSAADSTEDSS